MTRGFHKRFLSLLVALIILCAMGLGYAEGGDLIWTTSEDASTQEDWGDDTAGDEDEDETWDEDWSDDAPEEAQDEEPSDSVGAFGEIEPQAQTGASTEWTYPVPPSDLQSDYVRLANKTSLLESDYVPKDLVKISAKKTSSSAIQMRKAASEALSKMFEDALAQGITLYAHSGYRSYGTQKTMYNNRLANNNGVDDGYVAKPGASDHQTGLGIDVISKAWIGKKFNSGFATTSEAQWMASNCYLYGFVIRYPEDKEAITEIAYEPWHLRYVGVAAAAYMTSQNLTLEEFTQDYQPILAAFIGAGGNVDAVPSQLGNIDALIVEAQRETVLGIFRTEVMSDDGEYEYSLFAPGED